MATEEERKNVIGIFFSHSDNIALLSMADSRKWRDKVVADREEYYQDGTEKMLDGVINGTASIRGKKNLSDEQRKEFADRMQLSRNS